MDVRKNAEEYISNHNIATLATCAKELPHTSTVEYANDGFISSIYGCINSVFLIQRLPL